MVIQICEQVRPMVNNFGNEQYNLDITTITLDRKNRFYYRGGFINQFEI